jgi:aryl-alcohol dehydrogenase-like predicted oxidoreductase
MAQIALGTVQFGQDYGISNKRGKITEEEIKLILQEAFAKGIDTLDTAQKYGDSEARIGRALQHSPFTFKIISKLDPGCLINVEDCFQQTLKRLNTEKLYGFLIHDFNVLKANNHIWQSLLKLKEQGRVDKIGVSLYYPEELRYLFNNHFKIDLVQVPYSIFDRRFEDYFVSLIDKDIEIHVRSVFLQGLVFLDPRKLEKRFQKIRSKLAELRNLSERHEVPVAAICLNFALLNEYIDRVIIGIESVQNLQDNINARQCIQTVKTIYPQLLSFREDDENIIIPGNWQKQ